MFSNYPPYLQELLKMLQQNGMNSTMARPLAQPMKPMTQLNNIQGSYTPSNIYNNNTNPVGSMSNPANPQYQMPPNANLQPGGWWTHNGNGVPMQAKGGINLNATGK